MRACLHEFLVAIGALLALSCPGAHAQPLFESNSSRMGVGSTDISVREIERRARASVVVVEMRKIASSVGSSFFVLCSIRKLAKARGGFRYVAKLEETPGRGQMLIGFLKSADEPPANADPAFGAPGAKTQVIELEQFAPICDPMMQ
jgi:hypothetical protein